VNAGYDDIVIGHEHLILKETRQEPVTRTIIVHHPITGTATSVQQVTNLTRYVVNDTQTGATTTGYWTGNWDAYQIPTIDGYVANLATVPAQVVNEQTGNQTIEVTYTPVGNLVVTQAGVPNDTTTPLTNLYTDASKVTPVPVKTIPGNVAQITNATKQPDGTYAVTDPTQDVLVNYVPVGRIIPVLADGQTPVPNSNPVQYLTNKDTVSLPPLPVFDDYTRLDSDVSLPTDPTKDTYVRYQLNPTVTNRTEVTLDGDNSAPTTVFVKGNTPDERQTLIEQYTNQGFQVQPGPADSLVLQRTYQIVTQTKSVTRQIKFVDQTTNQEIMSPQTQSAHLTRYAVIDRTTGKVIGYVDEATANANQGHLTTVPTLINDDAWTITGEVVDSTFVAQALPDTPANYEPATNQLGATLTAIPSQIIDNHWNDQHQETFTVYYRPQTKVVTQPSDLTDAPNHQVTVVETDDQGIQHPRVVDVTDALSADQLTKSVPVTRTIDYVYSPVASQVPGQQPNQAVNFPAGTNPTTQQQITIPLVRTASYTPTSNQLTYGPWELAPDAKPTLPAVTVPDLAGYQVVNNGFHFPNEVTFTADNLHNIEMTVAYEALPRTVSFQLVDQDANQTPVGQPTTLTG
ncbi:MAG: hypothetical protein MJ139_05140, partial [Limosilactobacillus sp.]|nr:hypothetical protein [Limosilactobacillus sp.]